MFRAARRGARARSSAFHLSGWRTICTTRYCFVPSRPSRCLLAAVAAVAPWSRRDGCPSVRSATSGCSRWRAGVRGLAPAHQRVGPSHLTAAADPRRCGPQHATQWQGDGPNCWGTPSAGHSIAAHTCDNRTSPLGASASRAMHESLCRIACVCACVCVCVCVYVCMWVCMCVYARARVHGSLCHLAG